MTLDRAPRVERPAAGGRQPRIGAGQTDAAIAAMPLIGPEDCQQPVESQPAASHSSKLRELAVAAWTGQLLATIAALAAGAATIESILVTGPALTASGMALALLTRSLRSWSVFGYGLSGPLVAALCATLIAVFEWGPSEAEGPILAILFIYAFVSISAGLIIFPQILRWRVPSTSPTASLWQFSLKSLLVLTTAMCVAVPMIRALFSDVRRNVIFPIFVVVTMALIGFSLWMFRAGRRLR
jgi:hypothetical protein